MCSTSIWSRGFDLITFHPGQADTIQNRVIHFVGTRYPGQVQQPAPPQQPFSQQPKPDSQGCIVARDPLPPPGCPRTGQMVRYWIPLGWHSIPEVSSEGPGDVADMALTKVTRNGHMTIPQPRREALGIEPGDQVVFGFKGTGDN